MFAAPQNRRDLPVDNPRMSAAAAAQKDRVVLGRQPANQRPVPDLFLGDEGCRKHGVDDADIDPGNVVGDQQCTGHDVPPIGHDRDSKRIEQCR